MNQFNIKNITRRNRTDEEIENFHFVFSRAVSSYPLDASCFLLYLLRWCVDFGELCSENLICANLKTYRISLLAHSSQQTHILVSSESFLFERLRGKLKRNENRKISCVTHTIQSAAGISCMNIKAFLPSRFRVNQIPGILSIPSSSSIMPRICCYLISE